MEANTLNFVISITSMLFAAYQSCISHRNLNIALKSFKIAEQNMSRENNASKFNISMNAIEAFNNGIWPEYRDLYSNLVNSDASFNYRKALNLLSDLNTWAFYITKGQADNNMIDSAIHNKQKIIYK